MTIFELMRNRLLIAAGVLRPKPNAHPSLSELKISEWSPDFEQKMRNRLIMGSFRYQTFATKRNSYNYDTATEAIKRIERYQADGNTEHLVDAANMCLLEYEFGKHPTKHFKSVDDGEHAMPK